MPMLNVYVSDDLAARIRETGISASSICQRALESGVREVEERRAQSGPPRDPAHREPVADTRPDDLSRESEGFDAGLHWATNVALSHELAAIAGEGAMDGDEVPVSREQGGLYDILARAGLSADSETNRVLSPGDPWGRGFLRACREIWMQVQPLS